MADKKISALSAASIGIGGMIGGGIFGITGLAIELTGGLAPLAFIIAGLIAILTGYSYWKLTVQFPGEGGTVDFLNLGFGEGIFSSSMNILLVMSYIVIVSVYAAVLASYVAVSLGFNDDGIWHHIFLSISLILLFLLNYYRPAWVVGSENALNLTKMILLILFVVVGLSVPFQHSIDLNPVNSNLTYVGLFAGSMVIFLNYEGFELIANSGKDVRNPKRSFLFAYMFAISFSVIIYFLIALVVLGHLPMQAIVKHSDYVLSVAADSFMGREGHYIISLAAILACASAINATFYTSGRLVYRISQSNEIPKIFGLVVRGRHIVGLFVYGIFSFIIANVLPLNAIATMGSAGFLIIFGAVNWVCMRRAGEANASKILCFLGTTLCAAAIVSLTYSTWLNPETRQHVWVLVGMIMMAFIFAIYHHIYKLSHKEKEAS